MRACGLDLVHNAGMLKMSPNRTKTTWQSEEREAFQPRIVPLTAATMGASCRAASTVSRSIKASSDVVFFAQNAAGNGRGQRPGTALAVTLYYTGKRGKSKLSG